MALTNDDLLAISEIINVALNAKLKPFEIDMQPMKTDMQATKDNLTDIKLHLENVTDKNIALLSENYVPAAKRYDYLFSASSGSYSLSQPEAFAISVMNDRNSGTRTGWRRSSV